MTNSKKVASFTRIVETKCSFSKSTLDSTMYYAMIELFQNPRLSGDRKVADVIRRASKYMESTRSLFRELMLLCDFKHEDYERYVDLLVPKTGTFNQVYAAVLIEEVDDPIFPKAFVQELARDLHPYLLWMIEERLKEAKTRELQEKQQDKQRLIDRKNEAIQELEVLGFNVALTPKRPYQLKNEQKDAGPLSEGCVKAGNLMLPTQLRPIISQPSLANGHILLEHLRKVYALAKDSKLGDDGVGLILQPSELKPSQLQACKQGSIFLCYTNTATRPVSAVVRWNKGWLNLRGHFSYSKAVHTKAEKADWQLQEICEAAWNDL